MSMLYSSHSEFAPYNVCVPPLRCGAEALAMRLDFGKANLRYWWIDFTMEVKKALGLLGRIRAASYKI